MFHVSVAVHPSLPDQPFRSGFSESTPQLLLRVLPGMVASGLGIDALCCYLGLARTVLLDLVVELDLPTPHDRPRRRPGGRNPWSLADTALFVVLWMAGWHAESLGQRFGRSAGGIWAKARRLGLPRRDRKTVFRPASLGEARANRPSGATEPAPAEKTSAQPQDWRSTLPCPTQPRGNTSVASRAVADASVAVLDTRLPVVAPVRPAFDVGTPATDAATVLLDPFPDQTDLFAPTPVGLPPPRTPKRQQAEWTRERDQDLSRRWWARQHYKAIARDMGISPSAVQSRRIRLELPTFHDSDLFLFRREELVDHFDPSVVEAHIAAAGYVERKCYRFAEDGKVFWFWAKRDGNRRSQESRRLEDRKNARFKPLPPPVRPCALPAHAW